MRQILKSVLAAFCLSLVLVLSIQSSFAQDATPLSPKEISTVFEYDQSAPLNIKEVGSETRGDVLIRDITFTSPGTEQPISAYLIAPTDGGTDYAGVLYVHWY